MSSEGSSKSAKAAVARHQVAKQKDKPPAPAVLFGDLPAALKPSAAEKRQLSVFAKALSKRVAGGREFTCLVADDYQLLRLNTTFLGHKYPTDVLSFPAQPASATHSDSTLGEIAISIERAAAQADEFGHAPFDEIRILMLHGLLHLTGLDHEKDSGEMALAEQTWRAEFQLPQTLIARSRKTSPASKSRPDAVKARKGNRAL